MGFRLTNDFVMIHNGEAFVGFWICITIVVVFTMLIEGNLK